MAVKSIVQIDVDDAKFKAFNELFQKYNAQLGKMPEMWANIGKETEGAGSEFQVVTAALLANNEMMLKLVDAQHKVTLESEKTAGAWEHTVGYTHKVLDNIRSATGFLLKWGAIGGALSALGTIGGFFGMDRLAEGVASSRRSALGLGVSYGQQQAVNTAFGRFLDSPSSVLGRIAQGVYNIGSPERQGLVGLGISQQFLARADPAQVMVEVLRRVPAIFGNVAPGQIGTIAQGRGIGNILSTEQILTILRSRAELEPQIRAYGGLAGGLDIAQETQKKYSDLLQTLDAAEKGIYKTFVVQLAGLSPGVGRLATSFQHAIDAFLGSTTVKHWIDVLGKDLEWFAGKIDSPEFKDGVEGVISGLGAVGAALAKFLGWFGGKTTTATTSEPSPHPRLFHGALLGGIFGEDKVGWWTAERKQHAVDYLMQNAGLPELGAKALVARWASVKSTEGGPFAVNPKSGAIGIEQALGARKQGIVLGDFEGQLKHAADELKTSESSAYQILMRAKTPEQAAIGASQFERAEGYDWRTGRDAWVNKTIDAIRTMAPSKPRENQPPTITSFPQGQGYGGGPQSQIYMPTPRIVVVVREAPGTNTSVTGESMRFG